MVAVIKTGKSLHNIFNYNENKVKQGAAQCIGEGNYPVDVDKMTASMRLNRLLKQIALNDNVKRHSVHISLNFDPSESGLPREKLLDIARAYMEKIGFGQQPYLIYQHHDAGHPHIHLVSVKVREDGSRIDMHNIGKNQSEPARREIEKSFGLIQAEGRKNIREAELAAIVSSAVQYGKMQSKKAIGNVLKNVLLQYRYGSLSELNAVLRLYNVLADRGNEDSRIYKSGGLVYRILDSTGRPIGVPVKASDFYSGPTLKFLNKRFEINNASSGILEKKRVKNKIDLSFFDKNISLLKMVELLKKDGIDTVLRKSTEGKIYGITYVDHTTKSVFNGSSLGKLYSAKALQERCMLSADKTIKTIVSDSRQLPDSDSLKHFLSDTKDWLDGMKNNQNLDFKTIAAELVQKLTVLENSAGYIPYQLKGKQKRKRKKRQSNNQ